VNRNALAAVFATVLVIVVLILGFHALGGPRTQRLVQSDLRVVREISGLAQQINVKWNHSGEVLPADLSSLPQSATQDPVTHQTISYRRKSDQEYELCAVFSAKSQGNPALNPNESSNFWSHPKGEHCFEFDTTQQIPFAPYMY